MMEAEIRSSKERGKTRKTEEFALKFLSLYKRGVMIENLTSFT